MARHRGLITAYIRELASSGTLDVGDGPHSRPDRIAHQPSETTQKLVNTDDSGGTMPDSIADSKIAAMDLSFDFENEAVRSQIYTRVLAGLLLEAVFSICMIFRPWATSLKNLLLFHLADSTGCLNPQSRLQHLTQRSTSPKLNIREALR
ncbi:hypothetical protein L207DRAFT_576825 [Hyaloscypha variabilis F]|uniref:Uncharacterized protein n=1 Tax=Hyaloscypha variabilis (strain UAMH 11265 / GT02V1 / F) TaxID=1149755 RepID=A0A2J6S5B7_HYAVF|nr:hypothetical protein L207DRAFT_576825 [Hyaloscypha variabilis F]